MQTHPVNAQHSKSVAEHGACFGVTAAALAVAAVVLSWIFHLIA